MTVIDDIKARIDLVELVSETVKLRKSGRAYMGLCPFHAHKNNTPSFAVWPDAQLWKCFGQCNEGGDVFKFVMKRDGLDFSGALQALAGRAGVELKPRTPQEIEQADSLEGLRRLLEAAVTYYRHLLKNAPQAEHARRHLAGRGLTEAGAELFQLGYALPDWDAGLKYFASKGHSVQDLLDAGLIVAKEMDNPTPGLGPSSLVVRHFDRFRDRLMIPVRDEAGRMTGFQARALQAEAVPKFMNSPQTALFDKGRTLFGLHLARKAIRESGTAVVVEGNLDVIAAHQAGFANVISSQGTALTEHQLRLVKKYAKRIILALDADAAGDAATLRGLEVAREALDRTQEIVFDPRGLVKVEGRLGADIRVMTLPSGLDPDDVLRRDPDEWRALVEAARPVVQYVIDVLSAGRNLDDPKVKTEIARTVLPLIDDVAQPVERDAYRQKLARVLKVDERSLAAQGPASGRPRRRPAPAASAPASAETPAAPPAEPAEASRLESYCLSALLQRPELLYKMDRELQALGLPRLAAADFGHTEHQLIFRALTGALEQFESEALDHLRENLEPAVAPRLDALVASQQAQQAGGRASGLPDPVRQAQELLAAVLRLRRRTLRQWLSELRFMAEDAREQGDPRAAAYQAEIAQQAQALAQVDRALAARSRRGAQAASPAARG